MPPALVASITLLFLSSATFSGVEACSSRATPKPRPAAPTPRPNVTFHTFACPPAYATYYCLNGATCFTVKIAESLMYSCECSDGYMGNRCEFKDLDGSYLPTSLRQRVVLERASVASDTSIVIILVVIVCMAAYMHCHRRYRGPQLAEQSPSPDPIPAIAAPTLVVAPNTDCEQPLPEPAGPVLSNPVTGSLTQNATPTGSPGVYLLPWNADTMQERWMSYRPQPPLELRWQRPVGLTGFPGLSTSPGYPGSSVRQPGPILIPVNRVLHPGRGHDVLPRRLQ